MRDGHQIAVRLDKWLWAARFFKTRQLAIDAIHAGKVRLNGDCAKPAKTIKAGDTIVLRKPPYEFILVIQVLSERRGSAIEARNLYVESPESIAAREAIARQLREVPYSLFKGRPTKKNRRNLMAFLETMEV